MRSSPQSAELVCLPSCSCMQPDTSVDCMGVLLKKHDRPVQMTWRRGSTERTLVNAWGSRPGTKHTLVQSYGEQSRLRWRNALGQRPQGLGGRQLKEHVRSKTARQKLPPHCRLAQTPAAG